MKIVCPTCNTRYDIPGDKIPQGRTLVETCKNCGGQIVTEIEEFQSMAGEDEFKGYAGFRKRFSAAIIDGFILAAAGFIIGGFAGFIYGYSRGTQEGAGALGNIVGITLGWLYFALMESSSKQGTLGKMALGIKVTDLSGNAISFGRAPAALLFSWYSWCLGVLCSECALPSVFSEFEEVVDGDVPVDDVMNTGLNNMQSECIEVVFFVICLIA